MPGALEARESLAEEIREVEDLRAKQVARLDELAAKKVEEPGASHLFFFVLFCEFSLPVHTPHDFPLVTTPKIKFDKEKKISHH